MLENNENYTFPWGFHLGDLHKDNQVIPLYTSSEEGGFCLLYDKDSEAKADVMLESLCLELLTSMPHESLRIAMFDFGRKKFYHLSPLQYLQLYKIAHKPQMMLELFEEIERTIISRYDELICCNRPTINAHNQKSKHKQPYQLVLINLENFPTQEIELRRIQNFVESAAKAGVYVIAFGNQSIEESPNQTTQTILKHFKTLRVTQGEFALTNEIFEFAELVEESTFKPLDLEKSHLMQEVLTNADLEAFLDPEAIKLEENTKVQ